MIKKFFLIIIAFSFLNADDIDTIVKEIKAVRKSKISSEKLKKLQSPIIEVFEENVTVDGNGSKVVSRSVDSFTLKAIVNNKAFINNKWVKVGDKIGSYIVEDIMDNAVYLKNREKNKTIFFNKKINKEIKIIGR